MRRNSFPAQLFSFFFFSLNPVHMCCTHVNPCGTERPLPKPPSPPLFLLPELTVGTIKTFKKRWGEGGKEQEEGTEIPHCCVINHKHSGNNKSPPSISESSAPLQRFPEHAEPKSHPKPPTLYTVPAPASLQGPQLPSSPCTFAQYPLL